MPMYRTHAISGTLDRLRYLIVISTALALGCAHGPPSREELARADYGPPVSQVEAQSRALAFLGSYLKDPDSARIEWQSVYRGWLRDARMRGGALKFGHVLEARVNAKNSYGGYTGYKDYSFLFRGSWLEWVFAEDELNGRPMLVRIH